MDHERDPDNLDLPASLKQELRTAFTSREAPPRGVEEAILGAARERAAAIRTSRGDGRRSGRRWWIGAAAAAAALLLLFVALRGEIRFAPERNVSREPVAIPSPGESVDVLDAFLLARMLRDQRDGLLSAGWDLDDDGVVDSRDVDRLLDLAVSLEGG